jgi:hypothetical protein
VARARKKKPILLHNKMFLIVGVEQLYYIPLLLETLVFSMIKKMLSVIQE